MCFCLLEGGSWGRRPGPNVIGDSHRVTCLWLSFTIQLVDGEGGKESTDQGYPWQVDSRSFVPWATDFHVPQFWHLQNRPNEPFSKGCVFGDHDVGGPGRSC